MSGPALNRVVADFVSEATGDQKIRLKELRGKNVVLYFYPKDSTPGCTQEGRRLHRAECKISPSEYGDFRRLKRQPGLT